MGQYFNPAIECADRETIVAIQNEKFVQMVASCYNNIPLYKERMDELGVKPEDIKSIEDLHKLPPFPGRSGRRSVCCWATPRSHRSYTRPGRHGSTPHVARPSVHPVRAGG